MAAYQRSKIRDRCPGIIKDPTYRQANIRLLSSRGGPVCPPAKGTNIQFFMSPQKGEHMGSPLQQIDKSETGVPEL